jgi:hypothetical protein
MGATVGFLSLAASAQGGVVLIARIATRIWGFIMLPIVDEAGKFDKHIFAT